MYFVVYVHLFVLVYDGHTISMVLCTLSFEILKYISITTCKQHNSPVGSLGFWVDQFLWDSWVPLTHEFTSSTNSSFFLFMQIHDITSPWKTLIPRYTILNHISYIKYKKRFRFLSEQQIERYFSKLTYNQISFITFHTHALHEFCIKEKFTRYQHTFYA